MVYASSESEAQRKILNRFVLLRVDKNGKEEVCAGKLVLLFHCSVNGESNGDELSLVRCVECLAPLCKVEETLKFVCLE